MKTISRFLLAAIIVSSGNATAFDTTTHTAMTAAAAGKARLGLSPTFSPLMRTLGLRDYNFFLGDKYIDIAPQLVTRIGGGFEDGIMDAVRFANPIGQIPASYTITGWLMRGATREDDNTVEVLPQYADEPGGTFNRVFGHFHDPQNNRGLTLIGNVGPLASDWATRTTVTVLGRENHYTTTHAREAMWRALTLKAKEADGSFSDNVTPGDWTPPTKEQLRKAYWATTFRALGDSAHLLQDMAQPQHTRNDVHSGLGCIPGTGTCLFGHDSFFEKYLKARTLRENGFQLVENLIPQPPIPISVSALDYTSYNNIPSFLNYADFFASGNADGGNTNGKGLANYSNRGFYSAGTLDTTEQPSPPPAGAGLGSTEVTDTGTNGEYLRDMAGNLISGRMTFRTGTVRDTAGGSDATNVKLSSVGIWDQFLQEKGWFTRNTLNYYNYDEQAKLLIPRAVAYSAGLIDYFFRGQLEIRLPGEGVYAILDHSVAADNCKDTCGFKSIKLKLANSTLDITPSGGGAAVPQAMTGGTLVAVAKYHKNKCYTTDLEGEYDTTNNEARDAYIARCRDTVEEIAVSQPLSNQSVVACNGADTNTPSDCDTKAEAATALTFNFTTPIPINATDLYLQVVYRGPLGSEQDAVVVGTKDIAEPTYFAVVNILDYRVCYNNAWYFRDENGNLPAAIPAMVDGLPKEMFYNTIKYDLWRIAFQPNELFVKPPIAKVIDIQPKEFARIAVLTETGRIYNDEITGYRDPLTAPPYKLSVTSTLQIDYSAGGNTFSTAFDYKTATVRKVKATVPLSGYKSNGQTGVSDCSSVALPPEPMFPPYPKPTVMKAVTITLEQP